ncbi:MAG: 5-carboxymethyl-2-hydroxymuconate Delta-isomerase [Gammaproteobacteria bacterium]|nr:5-carboxymethyl-2-hydroxymuconate Delta-isomerase [Gammaproteobacteria bacterium]
MPHCIIEYSNKLEKRISAESLLKAVHQAMVDSNLFDPDDVKVRTLSFENYTVGDTEADFIHITVKLLDGRDDAQKAELSRLVFDSVMQFGLGSLALTVDIVDMKKTTFSKFVG